MYIKIYKKLVGIYENNTKIIFGVLFILIIFLSFFPRSIEVLNQNPIFGFDNGREMLAAKQIIVDHKPILIGTEVGAGSAGITGIFHGPVYYYMLTIPFLLTNGNPQGGIYLMFIFGLLTVIFSYFLGKKLFGRQIGALLALLTSMSPVLIAQSRFIWSPNPPPLFILLSYYFTYKFTEDKRKLNVFLASFFAGFVYNFELGIAIPMSFALVIYSFFIFKRNFKNYVFLLLGFMFAYSPMLLFEVRHNFLGLRGILFYVASPKSAQGHTGIYYLVDHIKSFIYGFQNTFSINEYNLLFLTLLIVVCIYFVFKEKNNKLKYFISFLFLQIPITFFVFSFLKNTVYGIYLLHLNLVYLLFFCYIAYSLLTQKLIKPLIIMLILIFVLLIAGISNAITTSVHDYPDYGGTAKIKGKIDAIDYIYKEAKGKPFGLLVFAPAVYIYPYDYLIWWYGERKYHYTPHEEKKGTFFLLIETDPYQPWSYKGWLETVIKTGSIIETKTLPSGFIVQKRIAD